MNANNLFFKQATKIVMQDLVDCLLVEKFFDDLSPRRFNLKQWNEQNSHVSNLNSSTLFPVPLPENTSIWQLQLPAKNTYLIIALQPAVTQTWQKILNTAVYAIRHEPDGLEPLHIVVLDPVTLMEYIFQLIGHKYSDKDEGIQRFMDTLKQNILQMEWSLDHCIEHQGLFDKSPATFFQTMEQWGSLRDRPYHPLAKAKMGLNEKDYKQYLAEFSHGIPLFWVAIDNEKLMLGEGITESKKQQPMHYFLSATEQDHLIQELENLNIFSTHTAIPVHPWQVENILKDMLLEAFSSGDCHFLHFKSEPYFATSSLRSMAPASESPYYLKLPMSVYSLASSRYLPAIKMINGQKSERLFRAGIQLDAVLLEKVYICDETKWWAYLPEQIADYTPDNQILFSQPPRHLSAMLRHYPDELLNDQYRLIPMAALGTKLPDSQHHFFDDWITYRQLERSENSVKMLFKELCHTFFEINLRMFKIGMLGEVHGQNAVFIWKAGQAHGVLFRDHDSVRIHVPWLEKNSLYDPSYSIKKGHPNTLYHQRPEDLFFYFQTLAIQVNIRAIIDVLAEIYTIPAPALWKTLEDVLKDLIHQIDFDEETQTMLHQLLFVEPTWPFKMLLKPMIDRGNDPGSMPFGVGNIPNPFQQITKI
ncbi:IucA/IucC family protein [Acinetobacter sp. NIPH 2100]|uniref:IucA/IucC family protein n=1 Tax=Acinetobacter sp. NIPH 2100 TaxID=1217708 RepID=UPI0002CF7050|nr:IucA/IucC family protein [Acinetobacter sp. NIPH 2100]ENX41403.1 hypothetical protein F887_01799 [Acinetobacter sp. NIPH 2100]